MKPIEAMAKAYWNDNSPQSNARVDGMRRALLALAEIELPPHIIAPGFDISDHQSMILRKQKEFRAIVRALSEEK